MNIAKFVWSICKRIQSLRLSQHKKTIKHIVKKKKEILIIKINKSNLKFYLLRENIGYKFFSTLFIVFIFYLNCCSHSQNRCAFHKHTLFLYLSLLPLSSPECQRWWWSCCNWYIHFMSMLTIWHEHSIVIIMMMNTFDRSLKNNRIIIILMSYSFSICFIHLHIITSSLNTIKYFFLTYVYDRKSIQAVIILLSFERYRSYFYSTSKSRTSRVTFASWINIF